MRCVVCDKLIPAGEEQYSNTWERSRKRFPCCGAECCTNYSIDKHWMPAVLPETASDEEQARLLRVMRFRLGDGDRPTVVLREMLLAGVHPERLRGILMEAGVVSDRAHQTARELSLIGVLFGVLTGHFKLFRSRDRRDSRAIEQAHADLDRWEKRLAEASS